MIYGISYLGGVRYSNLMLKNHPQGFGACIFAEEFGDAYPLVDKFLSLHTRSCPIFEIQLIWDKDHLYGDKDIAKIASLSTKYNTLAKKFPLTSIELSPFCEHQLRKPEKYLDLAHEYAPECTIINSPEIPYFSDKYNNEVHGTANPPKRGSYNFDFDGNSCFDSNIMECYKKYKTSSMFKFWTWQFNLHMNKEDTTRRTLPSVKHIYSIEALLSKSPPTPFFHNSIWKSHAEQTKPKGDKRANKPVLITPTRTNKVIIFDSDCNRIITRMPYYNTFIDGRFRYYSSIWGYEMEDRALALNGSRFVTVVVGSESCVIRPAFRHGTYR